MATKQQPNFEQSLARLEEIVALLERGEAPLEQAMALFQEGAQLLRQTTAQLDSAEQQVSMLLAGPEGQIVEQPFQGED